MDFSLPQLIISALLFVVMFFGIGFLLNMLLRMTWFMAIVYPIVVILIIDDVGFFDYFVNAGTAFPALVTKVTNLHLADYIILGGGLVGAIIAGLVSRYLRKNGYQMF